MKINHRRKNPNKTHGQTFQRDRREPRSTLSRTKANQQLRRAVDGSF